MANKLTAGQEQYLIDARKYLARFPLREAGVERDYAAEWMACANSYQDVYADTLKQLEEARQQTLALRAEVLELKKQIRAKDTSFKPPSPGLA